MAVADMLYKVKGYRETEEERQNNVNKYVYLT